MINKITDKSYIIFTIIFLIGLSIGLSTDPVLVGKTIMVNKEINKELFLIDILKINISFAITLLFGFITFGVYNACLVIFNGLLLGSNIQILINSVGLEKTSILLLPHGFLEISWIIGISHYSVNLIKYLLHFFNSEFEDFTIFKKLYNVNLVILFSLVILAAFVENFVTPLLFKYLT